MATSEFLRLVRELPEPRFDAVRQSIVRFQASGEDLGTMLRAVELEGGPQLAAALRSTLEHGLLPSARDLKLVHTSLMYESLLSEKDSYSCFVGDVAPDATEDEVRAAWEVVGPLAEVRLMRDRATGQSKGYGFLHFATPDALAAALALVPGTIVVRGRGMKLRSSDQKTLLLVSNLPGELSAAELCDIVLAVLVPLAPAHELELRAALGPDGRARGQMYVKLRSNAKAEAARKALAATTVNSRHLTVTYADAVPPDADDGARNTTLYVANIGHSLKEDILTALFGQFGEIARVILARNPHSGENKGYGFIQFTDRSSCDLAIRALNDTPFQGQTLSVSYAKPASGPRKNTATHAQTPHMPYQQGVPGQYFTPPQAYTQYSATSYQQSQSYPPSSVPSYVPAPASSAYASYPHIPAPAPPQYAPYAPPSSTPFAPPSSAPFSSSPSAPFAPPPAAPFPPPSSAYAPPASNSYAPPGPAAPTPYSPPPLSQSFAAPSPYAGTGVPAYPAQYPPLYQPQQGSIPAAYPTPPNAPYYSQQNSYGY